MIRRSLMTTHDAMVHSRHVDLLFLTTCGIELYKHLSTETDKEVNCMACVVDANESTLEGYEGRVAAALRVPKEFLFHVK